MNYKQLIFEPRARPAWQAIDVGCLIARQYFVRLWMCWAATALPCAILLTALYVSGEKNFGVLELFLFWLGKPLYERAQLLFLSRQVFGDTLRLRDIFTKHYRSLLKGLAGDLSYRRLSHSRSMNMPVDLLEAQTGSARSRRLAVLHRMHAKPSFPWTVILFHLEQFLFLSIVIIIGVSLPSEAFESVWIYEITSVDAYMREIFLAQLIIYFVASSVIAPFYVSGGFLLYLNRRIHLEGWDLQLMFETGNKEVANAADNTMINKNNSSINNKPADKQGALVT